MPIDLTAFNALLLLASDDVAVVADTVVADTVVADTVVAVVTADTVVTDISMPETLEDRYVKEPPSSPCWKIQLGTNKRRILPDFTGSVCSPNNRSEYPAIYIGGYKCSPPIESDEVHSVILEINEDIAYYHEQTSTLSGWQFENWLNEQFQRFDLWTSRIHPLEAMKPPSTKKAVGTKPRNKRPNKHPILAEVAMAETNVTANKIMQAKIASQDTVGKPAQADAGKAIPVALEFNVVKVEGEKYDKREPRLTEYQWRQKDKERLADAKRNANLRNKAEVKPEQVKLVATLPLTFAYELCRYSLEKYNIVLNTLAQGVGDDGVEMALVYRPETVTVTDKKGIASKASFLMKKASKAVADRNDKTRKMLDNEATKNLRKGNAKLSQDREKALRDAAFARNVDHANTKAEVTIADKNPRQPRNMAADDVRKARKRLANRIINREDEQVIADCEADDEAARVEADRKVSVEAYAMGL